jgi:AcrR family transcriptional regulator
MSEVGPHALSEELIDAAADVLGRRGLGGLTISAVAEQAGCSRVTLHRNGVQRGALVAAVVARAAGDLRAELWPAVHDPASAADRLAEALHTLCRVVERHRRVLAALYHAPERPHATAAGRTTVFDFSEPFERLLRDGRHDGTLRAGDPAEDAELLVNLVTWTYIHLRLAHRWPAGRAADRVVGAALASHGTDPGGSSR